MNAEPSPQRGTLGKQPQEQAEQADDHGEVLGARRMTCGVLVRVTCRPGRGLVLRCVLRVAGALGEVADEVQGPEGPVAQQQRADEQHGQLPSAKQLHRLSGPVLLDMGDGILPFGRGGCSSTLSKEALLFASCFVAPTDVLSALMFGPCIGDCAVTGVRFHSEDCCFGWSILINPVAVVLSA
jgi:hypothetical protein